MPHIRYGLMVALGIGSDKRHTLLTDLPTLAEAKAGNVNVDMWWGVFAPRGTPADTVNLYNREIKQLLGGEDVQKAFFSQGMDPSGSTPQAFAQLVERDAERWAP